MPETYLVRHGRTLVSAAYRVNGDPTIPVPLDETGQAQCQQLATAPWLDTIACCVTSRFPRASQTADLLLAGRAPERVIDPRLDEIAYGTFEGGPWLTYGAWLDAHGRFVRPPGAPESLHEATLRLLEGLAAALTLPGPRLVVGHGLLVSVVLAARERPTSLLTSPRLPEVPYVTPVLLADDELAGLLGRTRKALRPYETRP